MVNESTFLPLSKIQPLESIVNVNINFHVDIAVYMAWSTLSASYSNNNIPGFIPQASAADCQRQQGEACDC